MTPDLRDRPGIPDLSVTLGLLVTPDLPAIPDLLVQPDRLV